MIIKTINKEISRFIKADGDIYTLFHYFCKDNFKEDFSDLEDVISRNMQRRLKEGNRIHAQIIIHDFMADNEDIKGILENKNYLVVKGYYYNQDSTEIFNITLADIYIMNDEGKTIERITEK